MSRPSGTVALPAAGTRRPCQVLPHHSGSFSGSSAGSVRRRHWRPASRLRQSASRHAAASLPHQPARCGSLPAGAVARAGGGIRRQAQFAGDMLQAQALAQHRLQQLQPRPSRAEIHTRSRRDSSGIPSWPSWRTSAPSMRSILLNTSNCGRSPAPTAVSTSSTWAMRSSVRIGSVDHMQQEVGLARLGQGRAERRDQIMRQIADETDGIGQHHVAPGTAMRRTVGSSVANSWSAA